MSSQSNPLLEQHPLPPFSAIKPEHIEPALKTVLAENRQQLAALLQQDEIPSWDNLAAVLEDLNDRIECLWSPVSHLNAVMNSDALRAVYARCLPLLVDYATALGQNKPLFDRYQQWFDSAELRQLNRAQLTTIENTLRDFTLSGVALDDSKREQFGQIKKRLADLATQFSNNVLDATHGWQKHIGDLERLSGVPETALQNYRQAARAQQLDGYLLTLDVPAYLPIMQYADNAALREELYQAYTTRASAEGPGAGQWDNSELMEEIIRLRQQLASLLGFSDYVEYSLATKMAESAGQVFEFLHDLAQRSLPVARKEFSELQAFATSLGRTDIVASDVAYYSEKLRLKKYAISQEELRVYFPAEKVISGLFEITGKLFNLAFEQQQIFDSWHPEVKFFHITRDGKLLAKFYLDLYARENKRGGAWMADCRVRRRLPSGELQLPVAFLSCNFSAPTDDTPSLLTHNEVTTLFHEFGHGLHHMLTKIDCAAVSGINGVAWDAVELPSQFLENWCWEKTAIPLISAHYQSGEPLPNALLEKMLQAKNFQSGMQMLRQLEFALFDLRIHSGNTGGIQHELDQVRDQLALYPLPSFNRFQHSFSHIFAGGYAAGYYSYKWAELLSADAFSRFQQEGIFCEKTAEDFLQHILEKGGSETAMKLFIDFRGREPNADALLRQAGIS